MKSKRSRVGRNFQAIIPPLLTPKERAEDWAKYLSSHPLRSPQSPDEPNSIQHKVSQPMCNIVSPERQYEQSILPPVKSESPLISKTLYDKVVAKSRKQHEAALEARRRQMLSRRKSTRRRGMRCKNYKEWDDPESYSSEEVVSPEPSSQVEFSPDQQYSARRKKRARSGRRTKPLSKKRYVPNRIKPVVINLVDLSDSPETPRKPISKPFILGSPSKGFHYRTTPQSRLIHTQQRMRYAYVHQPAVSIGNLSQARRMQHKVLNNLGVNHLPFQSPPSKRKVIGKLMGYRQSPNNAMIPVIEL